jgi:hypothetical protein
MDTPALTDAPDYLAVTSSLAMELAAGLSEPTDIFERHNINEHDAVALLSNVAFQNMLKEAKAEWNADTNITDRIRLKAQMALEELLLPTFNLAQDPRVPPPSRTDAVKLFERLSGVTKLDTDAGGGGPKFVLNISVGGGVPAKEITGEVIDHDE